VVSFTTRLLYTQGKMCHSSPIRKLGGLDGRSSHFRKEETPCPCQDSNSDSCLPACSIVIVPAELEAVGVSCRLRPVY
jgi:hypothetical protein